MGGVGVPLSFVFPLLQLASFLNTKENVVGFCWSGLGCPPTASKKNPTEQKKSKRAKNENPTQTTD